jgi:hypothetical protein
MRVLIACEYSGRVRDAFIRAGHDAVSCDILPTDSPGPHRQGDVMGILGDGWDLMVAHPPCTYLSVSGMHWTKRGLRDPALTEQAAEFFMALANAPIPRIAIENPVCIMSTRWRKPDQIIQPWQYGHDASKKTCLWLKGLPLLQPTHILPGGVSARRANQTASGQNRLPPTADRWKIRSETYLGIAEAMAQQWSN